VDGRDASGVPGEAIVKLAIVLVAGCVPRAASFDPVAADDEPLVPHAGQSAASAVALLVLAPIDSASVGGKLVFDSHPGATHVHGTITGLPPGAYFFGKRDDCALHASDAESERSAKVSYFIGVRAGADGTARIDDTSQYMFLDGPASIIGAIFAVRPDVDGAQPIACGRLARR
jgi:hypothetical protein